MATLDRLITTRLSKQVVFDYDTILDASQGESEYVIVCLSPDARAFALAAINFYADWLDRWKNFPDDLTRVDLIARANKGLMTDMACSEDIADIITNLASIALSQTEIRDNIAAQTTALGNKLDALTTEITSIKTAIQALDPSLFNDLEEGLNGVIEILGGVPVSLS